jgi:hypothetical protein
LPCSLAANLASVLMDRGHATIQVETDPHTACPLEPDQVV